MAILIGTDDVNDVLTGTPRADTLSGLDGDDKLSGGAGRDVLDGGAGRDTLEGGADPDVLDGGPGRDAVDYRSSTDGVRVNLSAGTDGTASGGHAQGDTIKGFERIHGSNHGDTLTGGDSGEKAHNELLGRGGADVLDGGGGNDTLEGGAGADTLIGGLGKDVLSYRFSNTGVTVDLSPTTGQTARGGHATAGAKNDVISGFEHVIGSNHGDTLTGDSEPNELKGLDGDDTLDGGGGKDTLEGGKGADDLDGGAGRDALSYRGSDTGVTVSLKDDTASGGHAGSGDQKDTISNFERVHGSKYADSLTGGDSGPAAHNELLGRGGNDTLKGGGGNDTLEGGAGADSLDGGDGKDVLEYRSSDAGVKVSLSSSPWWSRSSRGQTARGGDAEGDTISRFENVTGSEHDDRLTGDSGPNALKGLGGNDWLRGHAGADKLYGGEGRDSLEGDSGADLLDGGSGGDDVVFYLGSDSGVTVDLSTNPVTAFGGDAAGDKIRNVEGVGGSGQNDTLTGDSGNNWLRGYSGDDTLWGRGGHDTLIGSLGSDKLYGEEGNDWLSGRRGADTLDGGPGVDTVSYENSMAGVMVSLSSSPWWSRVVPGADGARGSCGRRHDQQVRERHRFGVRRQADGRLGSQRAERPWRQRLAAGPRWRRQALRRRGPRQFGGRQWC